MKKNLFTTLALCLLAWTTLTAQTETIAIANDKGEQEATKKMPLKRGEIVTLETIKEINSDNVQIVDVIPLRVSKPVIVEGYKFADIPKIEVRAVVAYSQNKLAPDDPLVIAIASDKEEPGESVPVFSRDDIGEIADGLWRCFDPRATRRVSLEHFCKYWNKPYQLRPNCIDLGFDVIHFFFGQS